MTNKELEKKIEELSAQIEALRGELKAKGKIWKPKEWEQFWYIGANSEAITLEFRNEYKDLVECGNAFNSKEKAEFEAKREKYTRLFRQYVEQHSEPLNWKDDLQAKWYVDYDHEYKKIEYLANHSLQSMEVYGSSEEVMREAVEFIGEENIKRYILSVEE